MSNQEKIDQQILLSLAIPLEKKKNIINLLKNSPNEKDLISQLSKQIKESDTKIIQKCIENKPNFLSKIKTFIKINLKNIKKKEELKETIKTENKLSQKLKQNDFL